MTTQTAPAPADQPFYLQGNFAPVTREVTELDLPVEGELPAGLAGMYLRNGPNPRGGVSPHWVVGDGMVHGVAIAEGQARWYRNRYVGPAAPLPPRAPGGRDLGSGRNNTHVIEHAGRILALVETRLPLELDGTLATVGHFDFGGAVDTAMTGHPKRCARTGELHFFGYQFTAPHLVYYVADAAGRVTRRQEIDVGGPSYLHDFAITEHYALFFDMPARMTADWGKGQPMPFRWDEKHRARVAVVPRAGGEPRWLDVAPGIFGHTANAFEEDGRIIVEAVRYPRLDVPPPQLHRWQIDLATGQVREEQLDDRPLEFPRVDERRMGQRNRYTYAVELRMRDGAPGGSLLRRYDRTTGGSRACDLGPAQMPSECVLVPGADAAEDAGWLVTFVYDAARDGSDLVVLDAREFGAPPVARVRLPQRVPFGFHGNWIAAPR
jgi:carotenoid cleavage dioxygenase-like enzyme